MLRVSLQKSAVFPTRSPAPGLLRSAFFPTKLQPGSGCLLVHSGNHLDLCTQKHVDTELSIRGPAGTSRELNWSAWRERMELAQRAALSLPGALHTHWCSFVLRFPSSVWTFSNNKNMFVLSSEASQVAAVPLRRALVAAVRNHVAAVAGSSQNRSWIYCFHARVESFHTWFFMAVSAPKNLKTAPWFPEIVDDIPDSFWSGFRPTNC